MIKRCCDATKDYEVFFPNKFIDRFQYRSAGKNDWLSLLVIVNYSFASGYRTYWLYDNPLRFKIYGIM